MAFRHKLLLAAKPFDPLRVEGVIVHGAEERGTGPCFRPTSLSAKCLDQPKNGPVPGRPVNGYVEGEQVNAELLRERTAGQKDEERLETRITHLREILAWVDLLTPPQDGDTSAAWQKLVDCRQLAHKIFQDQEHPKDGDRTRSTADADARRARHGEWYDGYLLDIMMDADSEIITQVNVLPANGDEAADVIELIRQEEQTHGNDVEALSMDEAGFNGRQVRQKTTTDEYKEVRSEHPKVERKLAEVMNRHGGRRARYRGRKKVLIQELMSCLAINVKRIVRLECALSPSLALEG